MLKENSSQLIDGEQIWKHEKLQQNENSTQSDRTAYWENECQLAIWNKKKKTKIIDQCELHTKEENTQEQITKPKVRNPVNLYAAKRLYQEEVPCSFKLFSC